MSRSLDYDLALGEKLVDRLSKMSDCVIEIVEMRRSMAYHPSSGLDMAGLSGASAI